MGLHDQNVRRATMMEPTFLLARLKKEIGLELTFRGWFPARSVPLPSGPDREADLIAVCDEADSLACLLIYEFQTEHDDAKPEVLQLEAMICLLHARDTDRGGGPVLPLGVFVYLVGWCPRHVVAAVSPAGVGLRGKPALWEVGGDRADLALRKCDSVEYPWGAMFWVSLMKWGDREKVISRWLELRDQLVPEQHRVDVTYVVLELAELVGRRKTWERVAKGVNVEMSQIGREVFELGQIRSKREDLTCVIQSRFPEVLTPDVERAITDLSSLPILKDWFVAAVNAKSAEDFLRVMRR